jgi:limonene-1,2-epoxide hydrolase
MVFSIFEAVAQTSVEKELKNTLSSPRDFVETSNHFVNALQSRNAIKFVSFYKDSVIYRDQTYGSVNRFSLVDLAGMFGPFLDPSNGFKLKVNTIAQDENTQTLMLLVSIIDPEGVESEYAGWFKFENNKIVEQIDFTSYPVKDLLESPRFLEYLKNENLEIAKIKTGD